MDVYDAAHIICERFVNSEDDLNQHIADMSRNDLFDRDYIFNNDRTDYNEFTKYDYEYLMYSSVYQYFISDIMDYILDRPFDDAFDSIDMYMLRLQYFMTIAEERDNSSNFSPYETFVIAEEAINDVRNVLLAREMREEGVTDSA